MSLRRYRNIIPDWERFLEVVQVPEPVTFRVNAARIAPPELLTRLEARGIRVGPTRHPKGFFQADPEDGPSVALTPEHWAGLLYIQQAVMGLPSLALGPRPGERVLDLCAAPGGKTTHLAHLMGDRGCLVAADVKERRLRVLMANVKRLGLFSVLSVAVDGTDFPSGALFDRVLVDAPCSGEGTLRGDGGRIRSPRSSFRQHITGLQERLLRRAVSLTRPGGVILYSTCTFAPEENEGVVSRVLADGEVKVEPIPLEAPHSPGLTRFQGEEYPAELRDAWRVYPHQMDSGGLFMARLRRRGEAEEVDSRVGWSPVPPVYGEAVGTDTGNFTGGELPASVSGEVGRFASEFGVDPLTKTQGLPFLRGRGVWFHRCDRWPVSAWDPGRRWRFLALGLRSFEQESSGRYRPTNALLARLGSEIEKRWVELPRARFRDLLAGKGIQVEAPSGYVALSLDGLTLGRGIVRGSELQHQIPKGRAAELRRALDTGSGSA